MKKIYLFLTLISLISLVSCTTSHLHQYREEVVEATCESDGYILHYCSCGDSYRDNYVKAFGHKEEVIPSVLPTSTTTGLTEGKKCSVCGKVLLEQEVIPCIKSNGSYIIFGNLKGADFLPYIEYDNTKIFMLDSIATPKLEDYVFLGWYTKSNGGEKIDYIIPNEQIEYPIFARWEKKKYHINYINAPGNDFLTEYDVETEIILETPYWPGLEFSYWTDINGEIVEKIEKGSRGDITLEANWINRENYAVNSDVNNRFETTIYENGNYYLIYNLGTISNVRLKTIESKVKMEGIPINYEINETYQCDESISKTISETIRNVVTNSHTYSEAKLFTDTLSTSINGNVGKTVSKGINLDYAKLSNSLEGSLGFDIKNTTEWKNSKSTTDTNSTQDENSKTISSNVTYNSTMKKQISIKQSISADMPAGIYSYVYSGTAYVYGIVNFDGFSGNWYLNIFTVLGNDVSEGFFYSPFDASNVKIESKDTLDFDIPLEKIKNDYFYIKYEIESKTSNLPMSLVKIGESFTLPYLESNKIPYNFIEWEKEDDKSIYQNGETLNLLCGSSEIIKFKGKVEEVKVKAKLYNIVPFNNMNYERFVNRNIDSKPQEIYNGNNLEICFDYVNNIYNLNLKGLSDPFATIGQTINLIKGKTYYVYAEIDKDSPGSIQIFYGINKEYSESNSIILRKNSNVVSFTVNETGTYNIRFDNDYGANVQLKNFTIYENYDEYNETLSEVNLITKLDLPVMANYVSCGFYDENNQCYFDYNGEPSDKIIELIKKQPENINLFPRFIKLNGSSTFDHNDLRVNYDAGNYQKYITGLNVEELIKMGYNKIRITYTVKTKKIASDPDNRDAYVWFVSKIGYKNATYNPNTHVINPYSDTPLINQNNNLIKLVNSNLKKEYRETTIDEYLDLETLRETNGSFYLRFGSEYDAYIGFSSISFQVYKTE